MRKKITCFASVAVLGIFSSWSQASAAMVEGCGSLETNLFPAKDVNVCYEAPVFLDVGRSLQLTAGDLPFAGNKFLAFSGEAQFGRLGVSSFIGGTHPSQTNLSTSANINLAFEDVITPSNLNPLGGNFLRLDIDLSGEMIREDLEFGSFINITTASFVLGARDLLDPLNFLNTVLEFNFIWRGDLFFIGSGLPGGPPAPSFVPYPGEEPRFTQVPIPGLPRYAFGTRGYVDIPLDQTEVLGAPFRLRAIATASSSCAMQSPGCVASTNFGSTALIGNARFVDQSGNIIQGASLLSESGYNYINPPGPLAAVPEPASIALAAAGLAFVLLRKRASAELQK